MLATSVYFLKSKNGEWVYTTLPLTAHTMMSAMCRPTSTLHKNTLFVYPTLSCATPAAFSHTILHCTHTVNTELKCILTHIKFCPLKCPLITSNNFAKQHCLCTDIVDVANEPVTKLQTVALICCSHSVPFNSFIVRYLTAYYWLGL